MIISLEEIGYCVWFTCMSSPFLKEICLFKVSLIFFSFSGSNDFEKLEAIADILTISYSLILLIMLCISATFSLLNSVSVGFKSLEKVFLSTLGLGDTSMIMQSLCGLVIRFESWNYFLNIFWIMLFFW